MADKEERILIARSTDYTITDTDEGALFEGKISPHCANVMTRYEAIERMAKAICETGIGCHTCHRENNKEECKKFIKGNLYLLYAEAALDALLGGKK